MSPAHLMKPASPKSCPGSECPGCSSPDCYAEGGKVAELEVVSPEKDHPDADKDMDMINSELSGAMGDELMSALESKDKKRVMESLEALVMHCLSK